jgi:putative ABC transport system permease protein
MFKNNLKIAIRSLLKQRVYSFINLLGLAVGVASCLIIVLFIRNEFSYDKFFKDHDRIYRMVLERKYPNHSTYYSSVPHSFEKVARQDFAEIELSTNVFRFGDFPLTYKNERDELKQFDEDACLLTDSTFFKMFSFKLLKGNPDEVLGTANNMVVTEEMAKRYFGTDDPIGKVLTSGELQFKVTGVIQDIPSNSHFHFRCILAVSTFPIVKQENFTSFSAYTFFKLKPGSSPDALESKFPKMVDTYAAAQIERNLGKSWEDYKREGNGYRYFLQPLADIHLDPLHLEAQMKPGGNRNSVYIMIVVAILILVIACINFMNLATARSAERAREVGVRKVMGSFKQQLIAQFLTESFLLSVLGVIMAVGLVYLTLPFFNNLTEKQLAIPFTIDSIAILVALSGVVGLLAGIYPSFILSSFSPVVVLKGSFTSNLKGNWIRNGLVIFQFWISIILMIGTLVINSQMKFMSEKSLGFDKEQLLVVERGFNLQPQLAKTFLEELRRMPEVERAAGSFSRPGAEGDFFGRQYQAAGSTEVLTTKAMIAGDELAETLGFELLQGRWFSNETNDSLSVLLNETALKLMDISDPIGHKLTSTDQNNDGELISTTYTIIGVVKDFNFNSLRDKVTPLTIHSNEEQNGAMGYFFARIKPNQTTAAIKSIEEKWEILVPEEAFKFSFLDERLQAQYHEEEQTGKLFATFSALALFVACIGLFALSAYTASLRTKEIGIRKVLGASVSGVVMLLSKDFTRMVLVAFLLGAPVAWYVMETWWLKNFAYRIQINALIILGSGLLALLIAWLTVSYQSIKAAIQNPVRSLRSE